MQLLGARWEKTHAKSCIDVEDYGKPTTWAFCQYFWQIIVGMVLYWVPPLPTQGLPTRWGGHPGLCGPLKRRSLAHTGHFSRNTYNPFEILVSWYNFSNIWKKKMFQTTNQFWTVFSLFWAKYYSSQTELKLFWDRFPLKSPISHADPVAHGAQAFHGFVAKFAVNFQRLLRGSCWGWFVVGIQHVYCLHITTIKIREFTGSNLTHSLVSQICNKKQP